MAAAFGEHLVLDLDRIGAGALQELDGAHHVHGVAEASVGVDHQRPRKHLANGADVVRQLAERHQPVVGNAEIGVSDAGAGDIGGRKAEIGHDTGGERIAHARQDDGGAGLEQGSEVLAGGGIVMGAL